MSKLLFTLSLILAYNLQASDQLSEEKTITQKSNSTTKKSKSVIQSHGSTPPPSSTFNKHTKTTSITSEESNLLVSQTTPVDNHNESPLLSLEFNSNTLSQGGSSGSPVQSTHQKKHPKTNNLSIPIKPNELSENSEQSKGIDMSTGITPMPSIQSTSQKSNVVTSLSKEIIAATLHPENTSDPTFHLEESINTPSNVAFVNQNSEVKKSPSSSFKIEITGLSARTPGAIVKALDEYVQQQSKCKIVSCGIGSIAVFAIAITLVFTLGV